MLKDLISALIGLIGIALVSFGAWLFKPAVGYIVLGIFLITWSMLMARSTAYANAQQKKGKK